MGTLILALLVDRGMISLVVKCSTCNQYTGITYDCFECDHCKEKLDGIHSQAWEEFKHLFASDIEELSKRYNNQIELIS